MNLVLIVFPLTFTHPGQHSVTRCHALSSPTVLPTGLASRASHPPLTATTHPHSLSVSHPRDWKPGNWFPDATAARPLKWSWHVYSSQKDTGGLFSQEKQPKLQGCIWTKKLWKEQSDWLMSTMDIFFDVAICGQSQQNRASLQLIYFMVTEIWTRFLKGWGYLGMMLLCLYNHKFCDWN